MSNFTKGILVLLSGNIGAQLILIVSSPLISRLYSPQDIGYLAIFTSILSPLATLSTFRFELAIPIAKTKFEAQNLALLTVILALLSSLVFAFIILLFGNSIAVFLEASELAKFLIFIPIYIFLISIYRALYYLAIRNENFKQITKTKISQSIATTLIQVLGNGSSIGYLIHGNGIGQIFGIYTLYKDKFGSTLKTRISKSDLYEIARQNKQFATFSTPAALLNSISAQLPILLYGLIFSPVTAGLYVLTRRVLLFPLRILGNAIGESFLSKAPKLEGQENLKILVQEINSKMSLISMPPILLLFLIGPELFELIFGEEWKESGEFAKWLTPWIYALFITSPLSNLLPLFKKQSKELIIQISLLITRILAILFAYLYNDVIIALIINGACSFLIWITLLLYIYKILGIKIIKFLNIILLSAALSILINLPVIIYKITNVNNSNFLYISSFLSLFLLGLFYSRLVQNFKSKS